ncbi:SEC-C metal-binding domain-containing protein [Paenibacillus alginolyticus]|uniref:SEC-C metal-binding domain-containing protein n=1 Tax=Paenibacillus alginolyticus TaxID=59839 RepID=A0ABT4G763_9BACL|nr:SEC-C metal-binding domain-containing protein [Paenibacillus alginolyticus]MCY9692018.1 SEC-C metal-binding domain-containing protein [Paenibacillus alginolyticus]MEC0144208.1 SEC-C metal-binding domain-containing protein [Paenibacillus alginolyticus]
MLTPNQIKPFILHPELVVSHAAINYFYNSNLYLNDDTLMPLVLQRLKQIQKGETFYLYKARLFTQSKETISEIMELLQAADMDVNIKYHLANILIHSDLSLLEPYLDVLAQSEDLNKRIQTRMNIANLENDVLFDAFEHFIKEAYGKYFNDIDTFYGDQLIHELAQRKSVSPDHILHVLDSYDPDDYSYEIIFYAQLAGEMQLESAIPLLCSFLGDESDVLPETTVRALVRIGTESVITTLAEKYAAASEKYYRLFASEVFGRIKLPASEKALLALLPNEDDITNATRLADGLCELGSTIGIPLVHELLENGYDSGLLNLKETLYAHCIMSDALLPQRNIWKLELEEAEKRRAKRTNEIDRLFKGKSSVPMLAPSKKMDKIGRNDPCPCGSSKKYKKCCSNA